MTSMNMIDLRRIVDRGLTWGAVGLYVFTRLNGGRATQHEIDAASPKDADTKAPDDYSDFFAGFSLNFHYAHQLVDDGLALFDTEKDDQGRTVIVLFLTDEGAP